MSKPSRKVQNNRTAGPAGGVRNIPDKLYFKIGEVKKITGVEPHVLRYWETEFSIIRPQRAAGRQRLYRRVDVENILLIKRLLYEDGFTVPGARKFLSERKDGKRPATQLPSEREKVKTFFSDVKKELRELKEILEGGEE